MEKKICTKCQQEKQLNEFAYKNKSKGIRKFQCKKCDQSQRRKYYLDNRDKIIDDILGRNFEIKKRNYKFTLDYLNENPCVDCGETDPIVLEFDHRDDVIKLASVSQMCNDGSSLEKIKTEIEKCDVRCANCHRRRTAKQFNWYSYLNPGETT